MTDLMEEVRILRGQRDAARAEASRLREERDRLAKEAATVERTWALLRKAESRAGAAEARAAALSEVRRASETFLACHDAFMIKQERATAYAMKDAADALRALLAAPDAEAEACAHDWQYGECRKCGQVAPAPEVKTP